LVIRNNVDFYFSMGNLYKKRNLIFYSTCPNLYEVAWKSPIRIIITRISFLKVAAIGNFTIMAKAMKKAHVKSKKKRADKYDEKLAIKGTFADVIKVSVVPIHEL
jgi:hypothetical protein